MATAQDLLKAAFKRARIIGVDQVPDPGEFADALAALNRMLEVWSVDRLLVFQTLQENFPLVAGQASRTIGTGGNFNTSWPVKIVAGCFVRRNGIDYPVTVIEDRTSYDAIKSKSNPGLPYCLFYDRAYPLGTIYFYYVPDAADTIYLNSWKRLSSLAALNTVVSLPPGYEQLIVDGMAIHLAPDYGKQAPQDVKNSFARLKESLSTINEASLVMSLDPALFGQQRYDITVDR